MDDQSVDRTVDAVGTSFTPTDLDKRALRRGLQWCRTWYKNACDLSPLTVRQTARLRLTSASANRLILCLHDEDVARWISKNISLTSTDFRKDLQIMIDAINRKLKDLESADESRAVTFLTDRSPLELLAGKYLPRVYERLFGRSAAFSRSRTGRPIGPYIRFAKSALEELKIQKANGEQYSPETIARALTRVRAEQEKRAASIGRRRRP